MFPPLYSLEELGLNQKVKSPEDDEDPVYIYGQVRSPRRLKWNKSRGQPDAGRGLGQCASRGGSVNVSFDDEDMSSTCTPYRLPRISPTDLSPNPDMDGVHVQLPTADDTRLPPPSPDKVWSRYGYEKIIRVPELGPQIKVLVPPPKHFMTSAGGPRFRNAAITPTVKSLPWSLGREFDDSHLQMYKSNHSRVQDDSLSARSTRLEPTPTPISRSDSPAKSVKSIHWILGHNRYHTFDKKGRSHIQGPYSREFNVTCMAPQNWLKMKWGRSKTTIY